MIGHAVKKRVFFESFEDDETDDETVSPYFPKRKRNEPTNDVSASDEFTELEQERQLIKRSLEQVKKVKKKMEVYHSEMRLCATQFWVWIDRIIEEIETANVNEIEEHFHHALKQLTWFLNAAYKQLYLLDKVCFLFLKK